MLCLNSLNLLIISDQNARSRIKNGLDHIIQITGRLGV